MSTKNAIIYLGSNIATKSIPFLLLPVMTHYLTQEEYGLISIYIMMISFVTSFISMGLHQSITRNFFSVDKDELSVIIGNILILLFGTFIFYFLLDYIITFSFDTIFSIPVQWIILIPVISLMNTIDGLYGTILLNERKAIVFGLLQITNTFIKVVVTVLFLIVFSYGWHARIIGAFSGSFVFFLVGLFYMNKNKYISLVYSKEKFIEIFKTSFPLIPHALAGTVIAMSDRLFIEKMVGLDMVGVYTVGFMFGSIISIVIDAFLKAWSPWFYKELKNPLDIRRGMIVTYTYVYIVGVFLLAYILSTISTIVMPYVVDEKFYSAEQFILWISLGFAVRGVYQIFFPYMVHLGKTSYIAYITMFAAIINLVLNYIFILYFGAIGAAYATFFSFLVSAALVFFYQKKYCHMPWVKFLKSRGKRL